METPRILNNIILLLGSYGIFNEHHGAMACVGKYHFAFDDHFTDTKDRFYTSLQCNNCNKSPQSVTLINTDETILINFTFDDAHLTPTISNGPLEGKGPYRFKLAYFNWLTRNPEEWNLNEVTFAAEMHLVFYRIKHGDYEEALRHRDGIAILSYGIKVRTLHYNWQLDSIVKGLQNISAACTNTTIDNFTMSDLLPLSSTEYRTYTGTMIAKGMTAPTCNPGVIWIDFEQTLKVNPVQVAAFQKLRTQNGEPLVGVVQQYKGPKSIIYRVIETSNHSLVTNNQQRFLAYGVGVIIGALALLIN